MKKICVFTGTRAEYGILYPLIRQLNDDPGMELQLLVTGSHLSEAFGETYRFIEEDGFVISEKVPVLDAEDSALGMARATGRGLALYAEAFTRLAPHYIVILGDRYEAFAAATAAFMLGLPVIHISGGDATEGAMDDAFRHAVTKMSYLHFTTTEVYKNRVIQLGEQPERVYNLGSLSIDNLLNMTLPDLPELEESIGFRTGTAYFLVTYHPETLGERLPAELMDDFLGALDRFRDFQVLITLPNADAHGMEMIERFRSYEQQQPDRVKVVASLGQLRYLAAIKHAAVVVGNSSSGIIEVPSFHVPTVDVGDRQKGRLGADSIIHTGTTTEEIVQGIEKALSEAFKEKCRATVNIYGDGHTAEAMMKIIRQLPLKADLKKKFYDLK